MKTLLHPTTESQIINFVSNRLHGLILEDNSGSVNIELLNQIVELLLNINSKELKSWPYYRVVTTESGTVGIDDIRSAQQFLRLKTSGERDLRRVLAFVCSDITIEAQNAFLKTLEEPPDDAVIILYVPFAKLLLPTILSRVQCVSLLPVTEQFALSYFLDLGYSPEDISKAHIISDGYFGLMIELLNDKEHPLFSAIATAKSLLQKKYYERLCAIENYANSKEQTKLLIQALESLARSGLRYCAAQNKHTLMVKWHKILDTALSAKIQLTANANNRLVLCALMISI